MIKIYWYHRVKCCNNTRVVSILFVCLWMFICKLNNFHSFSKPFRNTVCAIFITVSVYLIGLNLSPLTIIIFYRYYYIKNVSVLYMYVLYSWIYKKSHDRKKTVSEAPKWKLLLLLDYLLFCYYIIRKNHWK